MHLMKSLKISKEEIHNINELKSLFIRTEIQDISSQLCDDIVDSCVNGHIESFLNDHGCVVLAKKVRRINAEDTDSEIIKQLCSIFTDEKNINININSCYEILEISVKDAQVFVKIRIIKNIIDKIEIGVKQNDKIKKEIIKLSEYKKNEEKQLMFSINEKQQIVVLINNEEYKIINHNPDFTFSVSPTKKVKFSQGNLQYQASTKTWRFAEHQWDIIGNGNKYISKNYNGWIDLFCWGTGNNPTMMMTNDFLRFRDWGNNTILNVKCNSWFTLTNNEWVYVFEIRSTNSGIRYAKAIVNGVNGVILLPDNWSNSSYILKKSNKSDASFSSNRISNCDWIDRLEANGAVFLPAAGGRAGTNVVCVGSRGNYWSATYKRGGYAHDVYLDDGNFYAGGWTSLGGGQSVRLVCSAE